MSCGADWGGFEASYDEWVAAEENERGEHYDGNSSEAARVSYSRDASRQAIQADVLADQAAGYK